jgi:hypothetical protein
MLAFALLGFIPLEYQISQLEIRFPYLFVKGMLDPLLMLMFFV